MADPSPVNEARPDALRSLVIRAYVRGFGQGRMSNAPPNPMGAVAELVPDVSLAGDEARPEALDLQAALRNCISALTITVTNVQGQEPHWCQRQTGHDATCSGMLATIKEARRLSRAADPEPSSVFNMPDGWNDT